jgi:hypothetical protein
VAVILWATASISPPGAQPGLHGVPRSRGLDGDHGDSTYLIQLEPIFDGLRMAGVPEQ